MMKGMEKMFTRLRHIIVPYILIPAIMLTRIRTVMGIQDLTMEDITEKTEELKKIEGEMKPPSREPGTRTTGNREILLPRRHKMYRNAETGMKIEIVQETAFLEGN